MMIPGPDASASGVSGRPLADSALAEDAVAESAGRMRRFHPPRFAVQAGHYRRLNASSRGAPRLRSANDAGSGMAAFPCRSVLVMRMCVSVGSDHKRGHCQQSAALPGGDGYGCPNGGESVSVVGWSSLRLARRAAGSPSW